MSTAVKQPKPLGKNEARQILDVAEQTGVPVGALVAAGRSELTTSAPPRAKPPRKPPTRRNVVKRVTDEESGVFVDVTFDAGSGRFEAKIPGYPEPVLGYVAGDVFKRTAEILRATREYQWKPSIVVDTGRDANFWENGRGEDGAPLLRGSKRTLHHSGGCKVEHVEVMARMTFYRIEIAPKPGDPTRFVCRPHADDVAALEAAKPYLDAAERRTKGTDVGDFLESNRATVMPYTPALWAAVQQAAADVLAVGERLAALVAQPEALAAMGHNLLAAGMSAPLALPMSPDDL